MEQEAFESFFLALSKHEHASYAALIPLFAPDSCVDRDENNKAQQQQQQAKRNEPFNHNRTHIYSREGDNGYEASQLDDDECYDHSNHHEISDHVNVDVIHNESNLHEQVGQTHVQNNSIFRSLLTSLSTPSEVLLVVLDNCEIALYTFASPNSLPSLESSFPVSTSPEVTMSASRSLLSAKPKLYRRFKPSEVFDSVTRSKHMQMDPPEVTCVSLFPLELAYHCRVDVRDSVNTDAATSPTSTISITTETKEKLNYTSPALFAVSGETSIEEVAEVPRGKELTKHFKHLKNNAVFNENVNSVVNTFTNLSPPNAPPLAEELTELAATHVCNTNDRMNCTISCAAEETKHTYLRGIVGNSYGRVLIFSERGYAFSFSAHDAPVWRAEAIYCSDEADVQQHSSYAEHTTHGKDDDNGVEEGMCTNAALQNAHKTQNLQNKHHTLRTAMQHLGFITASLDGTIFIWRSSNDYLKPNILAEPGVFTRHIAFNTYFPPSSTWMLHPFIAGNNNNNSNNNNNNSNNDTVNSHGEASPSMTANTVNNFANTNDYCESKQLQNVNNIHHDAPLHSSILLHSISSLRHAVRLRSVDDKDYITSQIYGYARQRSSSANIFTLPRAMLKYTTAIAAEANFALIAREEQLYALDYSSGEFTLFMTATKEITEIVLAEPIAAAVCAHNGLVYLIQIHPFAVLGKYRSYKKRPILSVTLCIRHLLIIITDNHGSVELIRLPPTYITEQTPELGIASKLTLPLYSALSELDLIRFKQQQQQQQQQQQLRDHEHSTSLTYGEVKRPIQQPAFVVNNNEYIELRSNFEMHSTAAHVLDANSDVTRVCE